MLRMRDVHNDAQALLMEGRLDAIMAPTCNSVAPGGALLRDTWETIVNRLHLPTECKTILLQTHVLIPKKMYICYCSSSRELPGM